MEFETYFADTCLKFALKCKFTPMEFETASNDYFAELFKGVNLLRWSLKQLTAENAKSSEKPCKFTPMEFETELYAL